MQADGLSTIEDESRELDSQANEAILVDGAVLAGDLVRRCHKLLNELGAFQQYLIERKREHTVELKPFHHSISAEGKSLEKLRSASPASERTVHTLRSSNLPFHEAVWDTAKASTGFVAFTKRFYWDTPASRNSKRSQGSKGRCALVDVVAQDGQQWIKVSTVTESRLLFELAKAGWEGVDSDSDSDGDGILVNGLAHATIDNDASANGGLPINNGKDQDRVDIIRQAQDLQKAALAQKVHYKHPCVTVILPKISNDPPPEITRILDTIRSTGATVHLGPASPPSDLHAAFQNLAPDPFINLTPTLNIDCTILLALVSDLSHCATDPQPWFHRAISRQIESERQEQLLPTTLWPAMAGRDLICTEEAARRMYEIVDTIGTESERKRTDLLILALGQTQQQPPDALRHAFARLSNYPIPSNWNLPIKVVPSVATAISNLPPAAQKVKESLTSINQSVFLYGWTKGWTTLTSNRTVAKLIEETVEGEEGEQIGPKVWLYSVLDALKVIEAFALLDEDVEEASETNIRKMST
ncbi:MAG: hypothetical protein Q9177_001574 [Variospora cf. flavescens]